ncbi:conserved hypothetical protein [Theileria orientalis strain Shintoku]|uniref:Uncharacterized protein n=1 Tax=Theileria orientalis strain Shintoku TaxID=869250 RepID=J4C8E9_THEOR|nr:conserved hypothetical protein [Theileria orientalis strain Shintoku]BAM40668.1 conserved hypothetical protein [Theileria orientalis strain Shintoku]|eukprot:XP_009690969.1 conserved hypothetical protein [Theileria orientalis strain Shintoku]
MENRGNYSRYDTHVTFFMAGVCCMIINSVVDLESLVLLRFLGNSSYDAQTITFFLRRFNLIIGILISCLTIFFDVNVRCSVWHWMLFILYFLITFYIYLLSNNVLTISKYGLAPVFTISLVSHGLLVSTIVYIFEGAHVKYDKNVALCLIIFLCGCFSSGLLVKLLLKFSGDIKDDEHLGLRFYNRLFVLFTFINLVSCFLMSRLISMDKQYDGTSASSNKSLNAVLFSRSRWVFFMGCLSWSFSPMFNNFTASVINTLTSMEAFNLEYLQFIICLAFSFGLYLLVITDIVILKVGNSGTRSSETLTEVICKAMNITNEMNPSIVIEDGIVEDLVTNDAINIRLFRPLQPWCYLQWGFWIDWENYDSIDNHRLIKVMKINMMVSKIRDGFAPVDDAGAVHIGGDLHEEFLEVIDAKYTLTWEITCFIKQCTETLMELSDVFHVCCPAKGGSCEGDEHGECAHHAPDSTHGNRSGGCVLMCLKRCCTSDTPCLSKCLSHAFSEKFVDYDCIACSYKNYPYYRKFVYGILTTCLSEAQKLLNEIAVDPDLDDHFKVRKSNELSLLAIEQFVLRFLGILVYARVADEFMLLFKQMKHIALNTTRLVIQYICKHKCTSDCLAKESTEPENKDKDDKNKSHKCRCLLYSKFIQVVLRLHKRQIQVCEIVMGKSRLSLASVLPTLSMTRSLALFSHFFGRFVCSEAIAEHSDCKCGCKTQTQAQDDRCGCGAFSSRLYDLLDMMTTGLSYLSEFDGILSIIIFFYSYLDEFRLESIPEPAPNPEPKGPECTCCTDKYKDSKPECQDSTKCTLCICCLCCPSREVAEKGDKEPKSVDKCSCSNAIKQVKQDKKCCLCTIYCLKCRPNTSICCVQQPQAKQTCSSTPGKCCKDCSKECRCSSPTCSQNCCTCCNIQHKHENKESARLLLVSENSKKNLELITATRRTMVLQSLSDYVLKSNWFKDMYKSLNDGLVQKKLFVLYLVLCFGLYVLCVVGNVVPYVRNVSNVPKLTLLFSVSSVLTSVCILYSFLCMSDFGPDSSLIINLMILISMILCIVWSWTTQWLSYRILLYQQFEIFYNKFRLIYTGGVNIYEPKLTWWFEGFVSFIKSDFHTMYLIFLLKEFKDNYDPYSFGFTSRLKMNYTLLKSYNTDFGDTNVKTKFNEHMMQYDDFIKHVEKHILDPHNLGKDVDLYDLLDYRAFQLIPKDSYHFLTDLHTFEKMTYSVDMLYAAWNRDVKMTRLAERLQYLREGALKTVEEMVQSEVKRNNYDRDSIRKLKHYFDFRTEILTHLAQNCLHDYITHGSKLASIQLSTLISIYELEYSKRWSTYSNALSPEASDLEAHLAMKEAERPKTVVEEVEHVPLKSETVLKKFKKWKRRKLDTCDQAYDGSLICKLIVNKAGDEFEMLVFDKEYVDPINDLVSLISKRHRSEEATDEIEVAKYLSHVSKTRDVIELDKVKSEIANLILKDTSNYVGSLIKGYVSVCKSMVQESNMQDFMSRNNEIVIGEWIRWQGQHVSSDVIELFSRFSTIEPS